MDNNNFFFSDEYKKAIANMSSIAKSILPQIENLSNDYLCQQSSMQGVKSCSDFEIKNLVSDFAKGYQRKNLKSVMVKKLKFAGNLVKKAGWFQVI